MVEPGWLEQLSYRTPLVELGRHDPSSHYDTMVGDDETGSRLVMEHLLSLGHRRITHLTHHDPALRHLSKPPPGTAPGHLREGHDQRRPGR